MRQIAYISEASDEIAESDITPLMRHSRKNNARNDITGMLLVKWPIFLQILEGPQQAIAFLIDKLQQDSRHRNFKIIYDKPNITEREFSRWQMDCKMLNQHFGIEFADLDQRVQTVIKHADKNAGEAAHKLLLDLRQIEAKMLAR